MGGAACIELVIAVAIGLFPIVEIKPDPVLKENIEEFLRRHNQDSPEVAIEPSLISSDARENKVLDIFNARVISTQFTTVKITSYA